MSKQQTAVEWLVEQLKEFKISKDKWNYDWEDSTYLISLIEQAKQMEKEQSFTEILDEEIEEAADNAWSNYEFEEGNLYSATFRGGWKAAIKWYKSKL